LVSGQANVKLLDSTLANAIVQSLALGTYTVQVTYTVNGKIGTATTVGKTQMPNSLKVISNVPSQFDCASLGLQYKTNQRQIQYQVLDNATPAVPIAVPGVTVSEVLSVVSNSCNVSGPTATTGFTDGNGNFPSPDILRLCSSKCLPADSNRNPTGSCTMAVSQTWKANGFSVKSGTITYTCPGPPTGVP
jgi:hypothetical protein